MADGTLAIISYSAKSGIADANQASRSILGVVKGGRSPGKLKTSIMLDFGGFRGRLKPRRLKTPQTEHRSILEVVEGC